MDPIETPNTFSYGLPQAAQATPKNFSYGLPEEDEEEGKISYGLPESTQVPDEAVARTSSAYAQEVKDVIKSYGRGLVKEDFMKSPKLMSFVYEDLKLRASNGGFVSKAADATMTVAGGIAVNNLDKLSDEELFELWQDRQRSFAGGQTITTLSEAKLAATSDEEGKLRMGAGFELFDSMDNAFTGNGTWGESFDALGDYAFAAIWDPTTIAGLGIGRVYSAGGAKAAAATLKLTAKETFKTVMKRELAAGVTRQVASATAKSAAQAVAKTGFMKIGAKKVAATASVDILSNVGLDAIYQNVMIETDQQEDFSYAQSALAAAGAVALPMAVGISKLGLAGVEKVFKGTQYEKTFSTYKSLKENTVGKSHTAITSAVKQKVDLSMVEQSLRSTFADFNDNMQNYLPWADSKVVSGHIMKGNNIPISADDVTNLFYHTLIVGDKKGNTKGFAQSLADAGFVMVERDPTDKASNWLGDALSWMPDDLVTKITSDFENKLGVKLDVGTTGTELAANFKLRASGAGQILADSSYASRKLKGLSEDKPNMARMLKGLGTQKFDKHPPEALGYFQSVWKRLMTAAPATVALNVKGWGTSVLLNSYSDMINGTLLYGARAAKRGLMGDTLGAKEMLKQGRGTLLGMVKRGYSIVNYDSTLDMAKNFFEYNPEVHKLLYKNMGDTDAVGSLLERYNLSKESKGLRAVESTVEFTQKVTGTLLQDEVTKNLSFITNLEQNILKEYGFSYNDFIDNFGKDAFTEMQSERFVTKTVAPALDRTLRETFSKSWTDKAGSAPLLKVAKAIETVSSHSYGGFVIPFGRFFNTSTAFLGDTTGINALRYVLKKAQGYEVDVAQESGQELLAKGIAGLSLYGLFAVRGVEKIENGLSWNQERDTDTGEILDLTYDAPESYFHIVGQVLGHLAKDGEVPKELQAEALASLGGQTFRAGEDALKALGDFFLSGIAADVDSLQKTTTNLLLASITNAASGITRPLDPINQAAMVVSGDYDTPDRRQGAKFLNESLRYLDKLPNLLGFEDNREVRYSPTQGKKTEDVGKSFGARTTPENTPINLMLNSIGARDWQKLRWEGDAAVKNRLDQLIYPSLNTLAAGVLEKHPDFFKKSLGWRQERVEEIIKAAKTQAEDVLNTGVGNDESLSLLRELSGVANKSNVKKAMDYLGLEGEATDIIALDGGKEKIKTLIYMSKEWDKIMYDAE